MPQPTDLNNLDDYLKVLFLSLEMDEKSIETQTRTVKQTIQLNILTSLLEVLPEPEKKVLVLALDQKNAADEQNLANLLFSLLLDKTYESMMQKALATEITAIEQDFLAVATPTQRANFLQATA